MGPRRGFGRGFGGGRGFRVPYMMLQGLNLTESQITQIEDIRTKVKLEVQKLGLKISELNVKLKKVLFKANPDENEIKSIIKQINAVRSKMIETIIMGKVKIIKVLNPLNIY